MSYLSEQYYSSCKVLCRARRCMCSCLLKTSSAIGNYIENCKKLDSDKIIIIVEFVWPVRS